MESSGVIPADFLVINMAANPLRSMYFQTSIGGTRVRDLSCGCLTEPDVDAKCEQVFMVLPDSALGSIPLATNDMDNIVGINS